MIKKLRKDKRGTTLIELLLYIAISSFVLVNISGIITQLVYNQVKLEAITREDETARTLMHLIVQNITEAKTINTPNYNGPSTTSLALTDKSGNTITYTYSSGAIYRKINSLPQTILTPPDIYVFNVAYTVESEAGVAPSINIQLDLQQSATNSLNRTHYETTGSQRTL